MKNSYLASFLFKSLCKVFKMRIYMKIITGSFIKFYCDSFRNNTRSIDKSVHIKSSSIVSFNELFITSTKLLEMKSDDQNLNKIDLKMCQ